MDMILTKTPRKKEVTQSLLDTYQIYYEELPRPERVTSLQKVKRWVRSFGLDQRQRNTMNRLASH